MQVLSPVGRFAVNYHGLYIQDRRIVVRASLGAWRSEVTLERSDIPLISSILAVFSALPLVTFCLGRRSASRKQVK